MNLKFLFSLVIIASSCNVSGTKGNVVSLEKCLGRQSRITRVQNARILKTNKLCIAVSTNYTNIALK